jgi:hypothetical protein
MISKEFCQILDQNSKIKIQKDNGRCGVMGRAMERAVT